MPFDEQPPKQDAYSLESFVSWLETRDPAESYFFGDLDDCLICRYLKAKGEFPDVGYGSNYCEMSNVWVSCEWPHDIGAICVGQPNTVGGALSRIRAAQAEAAA